MSFFVVVSKVIYDVFFKDERQHVNHLNWIYLPSPIKTIWQAQLYHLTCENYPPQVPLNLLRIRLWFPRRKKIQSKPAYWAVGIFSLKIVPFCCHKLCVCPSISVEYFNLLRWSGSIRISLIWEMCSKSGMKNKKLKTQLIHLVTLEQ